MSSVKIAGDTSGLITLAAPAAAGTNTITMPASTGTMALTSDISATALTITKAVTGAVTALRGVSNAATTGNVGVYPTLNTFGSITNTTMAGLTQNRGNGKTAIKAASGRSVATPADKGETRIFGQYLNGSNVWVNNATPLVIETATLNHQVDSGTARVWSTDDGKFQVAGGNITNVGAEASACITMITVTVNESTGAPTVVGTPREVYYDPNVSGGRGVDIKVPAQDYCQVRLWAGDDTYSYQEFFYTSGAGWAAGVSSTLAIYNSTYDYPAYTTANNALSVARYDRLWGVQNAAVNRLIQVAPNALRTLVISSNVIQSTTAVNPTLSGDYNEEGQTTMLDATHCLQIYKDTSGVRKIKTFTVAADGGSVSLIDTFALPSDFENNDQFIFKDSKNMAITNYPDGMITSVGLDTDFSILGTNLKYAGKKTAFLTYSGSGDVFNLWSLAATGVYGFQTYTSNAYSTPPFNYGGVAATTASSGNVSVYVAGVVPGYSGMAINTVFYINNTFDGTFTSDSTFGTPRVGKAISQTEILLGEVL